MKTFKLLALLLLAIASNEAIANQEPNGGKNLIKKEKTEFQFVFQTRNFPLKVRLFNASEKKKLKIGSTVIVKNIRDLPANREWPNQIIPSFAGEDRKFLFVIENQTEKDFYFYATPHSWNPEEDAIGSTLYCLCYNTLFRIPAGSIWYRVGLITSQPVKMGERTTIVHRIVGVDKSRALQMQLQN